MNSKERVLTALTRCGLPDRVPIQFDLCESLIDRFAEKLKLSPGYAHSYYEDLTFRISANEIRTALGSDVVVVGGTCAKGFERKTESNGTWLNEFGMRLKKGDIYVDVVECPLASAHSEKDIEAYDFPDPYATGRFDIAQSETIEFGKNYFIIGDCEVSLFAMAWHLTGIEKYLTELAMATPWIKKLNDKVEYWTTHLAVQLVRLGVDAIWFGEDLGTQMGPLISPKMWNEEFKPRWKRILTAIKQENPQIISIIHSDGAVSQFLPYFIETGFQVYNPVQPNVEGYEPEKFKLKFGDKISFFGGIDQQKLLPNGDIHNLKKEMEYLFKTLGKDGGYLMAPAQIIQADTSPETVEAMMDLATAFLYK